MAETASPDVDTRDESVGNFEGLSDFDEISLEDNQEQGGEEETKEEVKEEVKSETEEESEEKSKEESEEEGKEPEKEEEKKEEEEEEEDLLGDKDEEEEGDEGLGADAKAEAEPESSWKQVGEDLGFDVEDNTFDSFKEAQKTFIESKTQEEIKSVKDDAFSKILESVEDNDSKILMLGLKNGKTREELNAPYENIAKYKAMSSAELVEAEYKAQGLPEDVIELKMDELIENDKLEVKAKEIRIAVDNQELGLKEEHLNELMQLEEDNKKAHQEKLDVEFGKISDYVDTVDKFMDSPISKKGKKMLMDNYKAGKYHALMQDPEAIFRIMAYEEFGEKAASILKSRNYDKGREEKTRKLHNIPPERDSGGQQVKSSDGPVEAAGNWDAIEDDGDDEF